MLDQTAEGGCPHMVCGLLLRINLQIDVYRGARIKLTDRLRVALAVFVLGVDFIVHVRRERRKTVLPILANDKRLHRAGARIGEINHGTGKRSVLLVDDSSREQTSGVATLVLGVSGQAGYGKTHQ